jgi:hypothetical protein
MRRLVVEFLALEKLFQVASYGKRRGDRALGYKMGSIAWSAAHGAVVSSKPSMERIKIDNATSNLELSLYREMATTRAETKTSGVSEEERVSNITCSIATSNYQNIFNCINNLGDEIKLDEKVNITSLVKSVKRLITFDDDKIKKLRLMNDRFRLFYLFKVDELISLTSLIDDINEDYVGDKDVSKKLLLEFNQLLNKLGDHVVYNKLFVGNITPGKLNGLNFPRDLVKLIVDFCQPSIYDSQDRNFILNQIAPQLSSSLKVEEKYSIFSSIFFRFQELFSSK